MLHRAATCRDWNQPGGFPIDCPTTKPSAPYQLPPFRLQISLVNISSPLPELAKRLRARRSLITEIITATNRAAGRGQTVDPAWAGAMLLALEDGFRLHRLIDPDTTPADSFVRAVTELQRLIGLGRPSRRSKDDEVVSGQRR